MLKKLISFAASNIDINPTMEIVPITKGVLRGLYAATQEEERQKKISDIVHEIYGQVLATSKRSAVTVYKHDCGSNAVGNIGSSTTYFNTVFAKATSAQYADVAEKYLADADYPVGTVLAIGGPKEVRNSHNYHGSDVIGTISENPAYIMNGGLTGEFVVTVALLGRVPCRVIGPVLRGDLLAASEIRGVAQTVNPDDYQPGCIIGKALQDYDDSDNVGVIEIIVGRL